MNRICRYAVGTFDRKQKSFVINSQHLFLHRALKEFSRQQLADLETALAGGQEWAIMSMETGCIVPLSTMIKAGAAVIRKDGQ